ncbi:MAG: serine hydrolase [Lachnospiraceae bacterium]|nr:serine hydrolase [Lachnospiraceae bacterium]
MRIWDCNEYIHVYHIDFSYREYYVTVTHQFLQQLPLHSDGLYSTGSELENIPIRACLQMASGIDFDEDTDMSGFSMRTLMGASAMKVISKYGIQEEPYTYRRYLSINTEILGEMITNATGYSLAEYMEQRNSFLR